MKNVSGYKISIIILSTLRLKFCTDPFNSEQFLTK